MQESKTAPKNKAEVKTYHNSCNKIMYDYLTYQLEHLGYVIWSTKRWIKTFEWCSFVSAVGFLGLDA